MAITANAIWETWPTSGSDTNGGGFDPSLTTHMPTDLNCTVGNTGSPVVTSGSYTFLTGGPGTGDVGAWLFIASGTNWTPGWYQIASVSGGAATLTAGVGTAILFNGATVQNTVAGCSTSATNTNGATWAIDYSQQATAEFTTATATVASTTVTWSAATVAMVGNCIYLTGGSGTAVTTGWYFITNVSAGVSFTIDRSADSGTGTGVTANLGGSLATLTQAFTTGIGSNLFWLKNTGVLLYTSNASSPPTGSSGLSTCVVGYNSLRGDLDAVTNFGNFPTVKANNAACVPFECNNAHQVVRNIISSAGTGGTKGTTGFSIGGGDILVQNCQATGAFSTTGFSVFGGQNTFVNCQATGTAGPGWNIQAQEVQLFGCSGMGATAGSGLLDNASNLQLDHCTFANNVGATSDGVNTSGGTSAVLITNCVFYNNGRDGLRVTNGQGLNSSRVQGCIFASNAGFGFDSTSTNYSKTLLSYQASLDYNAYYNNTSGARHNIPTGPNDQILSGNPFNNAAGNDFSLNNTAGAGAQCRNAGFPGTLTGLSTVGYDDIGVARHQDPAAGSSANFFRTPLNGV